MHVPEQVVVKMLEIWHSVAAQVEAGELSWVLEEAAADPRTKMEWWCYR